METEPADVIVLGAIRQGKKKFDQIAKTTKIDHAELDKILAQLEERGLIVVEHKKGWLGTKIEILITDKGSDELDHRLFEARDKWNQMQALYQKKDKKGLQRMMDDNRSFIPMLMFFGIMDIMMFSMMFSMMGASMTDYVPAESMPDGYGDAGADAGMDGGDTGDMGVDHGFGDGGFDLGF